jgi:hypothetical protein
MPKSQWKPTLQVKCGWNKAWDPPSLIGCVDPRGCQPPPPRNGIIYGSFEDDDAKSVEVGARYWYSCRYGMFMVS